MTKFSSLVSWSVATFVATGALAATAVAQDGKDAKTYVPKSGLDGKDVVWVGTPPITMQKMLDLAKVTAKDYVIDLGSGDGRLVVLAAKRGATAHGIEYNPDLVKASIRNAARSGVADKTSFVQGDIFKSDFSKATVLTLYLLPELNLRLRPTILKMKPGTRIASNSFDMGAWKPDKTYRLSDCSDTEDNCGALFWVVPAQVGGRWKFDDGVLTLDQKFQMLSGTFKTDKALFRIRDAKMNGEEIRFTTGGRRYVGQLTNGVLKGTMTYGRKTVNWQATKLGPDDIVAKPGETIKDCASCPEMVVVPAGTFTMGTSMGDNAGTTAERPQHDVTIKAPFAVSKFEVTFAEWDACVAAKGCRYRPRDSGWGRGRRPVINVSWNDAQSYIAWLSKRTGEKYRMLTEAEWEYAARAGTTTAYFWGDKIGEENANCSDCESDFDDETAPVGSFKANAFGISDMHGNVWEWVADIWHDTHDNAPTDGRARDKAGNPYFRVLRGGSWTGNPTDVRSSVRINGSQDDRYNFVGFRIAKTLVQ